MWKSFARRMAAHRCLTGGLEKSKSQVLLCAPFCSLGVELTRTNMPLQAVRWEEEGESVGVD